MQNKLRLSPDIALQMLQEGNEHFLKGALRRPQLGPVSMAANADRQKPFAVVITCADSRVSPELVFDCGIGDIFVTRTAGNVADELAGSMAVLIEKIKPAVAEVRERCPDLEGEALETEVARVNARMIAAKIVEDSDILRQAIEAGRVCVMAALCDITSGSVAWLDSDVTEKALV